ncbi:VWA domain-containing protein [Halomarina salina]|uniref:VWA domain-containing protein n=1 Tax=Halomarina salina TaxID=1872699 RepID=A0ABD5RSG4_9EURY|nr:VWA domain-containing protein [Halomarina salina]
MTDPPDFVAARDHVRDELVRFVRSLRRAGVHVPANSGTTAARALVEIGFDDEATARVALRACLVTDADDFATFERQFSEFWRRLTAGLDPEGPAPRRDDGPEGTLAPLGGDPAPGESGDDRAAKNDREQADDEGGEDSWRTTSAEGAIVSSRLDEEERERTEAAWYSPTAGTERVAAATAENPTGGFDEVTDALASLRGRRWRGGGDDGADVRRAMRTSFETGGTVVTLPQRQRPPTAVRALWLVDVSRSVLDTVDRSFLLSVLRRARADWRDCRVFFFDEDCREVSASFDHPTAAAALDALDRAEAEWGGGTRIGQSLAGLRQEAPDAVDARTVVFVVSDGLEMGDTDVLERELAWVSRRAEAVLWLNPLASSPGYEPTARGMAAALPFVDGLFAFGTPADLAELGRQVRRHGTTGRIGYEYDPRRGVS